MLAEVVDFDVAGRRVVADRPAGERLRLPYDDLVVAAGVRQSYFGHDEFARWAPGMKTLADALAIRQKVFGAFEMAESATDDAERRRWLTFALVGGGPTGVELAGQIRELATRTLRAEFRRIEPEDARVLLFDGGDAPLAAFGPKLAAKAAQTLEKLGVELHMRSRRHRGGRGRADRATDAAGARRATTPGRCCGPPAWRRRPCPAALARATGAARDRAGRIKVGPDLTIAGHPEIFVVGDVMCHGHLPGLAEVAMQSGLYAGRRIRRRLSGREPHRPFRYRRPGLGRLHRARPGRGLGRPGAPGRLASPG